MRDDVDLRSKWGSCVGVERNWPMLDFTGLREREGGEGGEMTGKGGISYLLSSVVEMQSGFIEPIRSEEIVGDGSATITKRHLRLHLLGRGSSQIRWSEDFLQSKAKVHTRSCD